MAIVRCYLRDPTFSRFDTIPECDRRTHTQTDRQTDRHTTTAYTALSKASRGKNYRWWLGGIVYLRHSADITLLYTSPVRSTRLYSVKIKARTVIEHVLKFCLHRFSLDLSSRCYTVLKLRPSKSFRILLKLGCIQSDRLDFGAINICYW